MFNLAPRLLNFPFPNFFIALLVNCVPHNCLSVFHRDLSLSPPFSLLPCFALNSCQDHSSPAVLAHLPARGPQMFLCLSSLALIIPLNLATIVKCTFLVSNQLSNYGLKIPTKHSLGIFCPLHNIASLHSSRGTYTAPCST